MTTQAPTHCGAPMVPDRLAPGSRVQVGWVCLSCRHKEPMFMGPPVPVKPRGKTIAERVPEASHKKLMQETADLLRAHGYEVAVVGQLKAKGSGTTVGFGDMPIGLPGQPFWILGEAKVGSDKPSDEQQRFIDMGLMFEFRSPEEALQKANWEFRDDCCDEAAARFEAEIKALRERMVEDG